MSDQTDIIITDPALWRAGDKVTIEVRGPRPKDHRRIEASDGAVAVELSGSVNGRLADAQRAGAESGGGFR